MGWRPEEVRRATLPDFAVAVAAWNVAQDAASGNVAPRDADEVAAKLRRALDGGGP